MISFGRKVLINTNVVDGNLGKQSMREDYLRAVGSSRVFRVELKR